MNIMWVINTCPFPIDSGGKVVIANRIRELSKYHNIYLIVECAQKNEQINDRINEVTFKSWVVDPENKSFFKRLGEFVRYSRNISINKNKNISHAMQKCLDENDIDIILIEFPMTYVNYLPVRKNNKGIPIIVNQHNIEFENVRSKIRVKEISLFLKIYSLIESKKIFAFERKMNRDRNIVGLSFVSNNDLQLYANTVARPGLDLFLSPIGTHDLGISESVPKRDDSRNIVLVASFDYGPNIHGAQWFCERVMPIIRKSVSGVKLYLVGKNPSEAVKKLAQEDVIVTGTVPDLKPYYDMADLIVVPIFYGGGVKTKLIEAGCFGKPVVATDQGRKGTEYRDGIDLLIADDVDDFGEKCINVLNNATNYHELGKNMRLTTKRLYMWDAIGEDYNRHMSKIIREYNGKNAQNKE